MSSTTATKIHPVRHPWRWVGTAITLLFLAGLVWAFATAQISWTSTFQYLFHPGILAGVGMTLLMSVLAMVLGTVFGLLATAMRSAASPVVRWVAIGYIWFFRAVPMLVQLLIWFNLALIFPEFSLPGTGLSVDTNTVMTPFVASFIGLSIGEGAYIAEIIRSGISSIPEAQRTAGAALGMRPVQVFSRVVFPQAIRVMVPPYGSEFINMLKMTSLGYTIGLIELMGAASRIYRLNYEVVELLFTASIWYVILVFVFSGVQSIIERRLNAPHMASTSRKDEG